MRYTLRSGNPSEAEITFYGNVRQAINCKDPELILSGPRDTGKTLGLLYKLHCLAWKYPRASIVIARKRATDLTSTVVQTYRYKVLRPDEPIRIYGGESPSWFDYPNGSRIWLAGLDKPGKVLSAEHDIIYVNQAEEISLIDWLALLGSATGRAGHIPYAQVIGDCNPSSPTHWIRTRAKSPSNPDGALTLIESSHRDNPDLYDQKTGLMTEKGEQRLGRLRSLTGHLLQRWYYGMWVAPEGAIYSVFDEARHKVRAFPIPPLWPRFVGIDPIGAYVAAVWVALDPTNGVLNVYREYYEPFGIPTNQHAANILRHSGYQPNGRPLTALAAEPIHYWVVGQPAERQARADWTASGIPASCPAFSDLWMGIDRVNALLSENSLVIHDSCPMLLNEIGDYRRTLKDGVPTESIENKEVYHCLTGDTMVTTDRGNIPIRDIAPDSKVLTRAGYRRVLGSACTNPAANVYKVTFSDGTALTGTAEHLIWTKGRGYVALHSLRYSDTMLTSDEVRGRCKARKSRMMATSGIDTTQPQKGARTDCTSRALSMGSSPTSIVTYGKSTMGQFQWVTLYTTSTATPSTTPQTIFRPSPLSSISENTGQKNGARRPASTPAKSASWPLSGIVPPKVGNGIACMANVLGRIASRLRLSASSAATALKPQSTPTPAFAPTDARRLGDALLASTTSSERAPTAASASRSIVTASNAFAPVSVLSVTALPQREPVYNLEVEDTHEFFANGVLVHNCLDALRYAIVGPEGLGTKQRLVDLRQPIGPQW